MLNKFGDRHERIDRELLVDVGFVGLIAALLSAVHAGLPPTIRSRLIFDHEAFDVWTLLTSAYVHYDFTHLSNNLAGFLMAAAAVYWLCCRLGARQWFRVTTAAFLFLLPILVNLSSYVILGVVVPDASPTGRGFSGVVAGFVGFLYAAFIIWIATRTTRSLALHLGEAIGVLMVWALALIYRGFELQVAGLVLFAMGLTGWGVTAEINKRKIRSQWRTWLPEIGVGFGITSLLLWFLIALFPANFVGSGVATNIFAHAAGFVSGTIIALTLWRIR